MQRFLLFALLALSELAMAAGHVGIEAAYGSVLGTDPGFKSAIKESDKLLGPLMDSGIHRDIMLSVFRDHLRNSWASNAGVDLANDPFAGSEWLGHYEELQEVAFGKLAGHDRVEAVEDYGDEDTSKVALFWYYAASQSRYLAGAELKDSIRRELSRERGCRE